VHPVQHPAAGQDMRVRARKAVPSRFFALPDARPALRADRDLLVRLLRERPWVRKAPRVIVLNKTGGMDRKDLVIAAIGGRFRVALVRPGVKEIRVE
jgi:hypothetical protein